jgi:hypothetical protein
VWAAPGAQPAQVSGACPDRVDPVTPVDLAEAEGLIVGTWIFCDEGSVFEPTSASEVGVEFTDDGRFYRVADDGAGGLLRMEGLEQQGSWAVVEAMPGTVQLNMSLLGDGTVPLVMEFYGTPLTQMHVPDRDISFVPWTGAAPVPGLPADVGGGPCGVPQDPIDLTSVGQVEQLLVGSWLRCAGSTPFGPPAFGEVGLLFDPDGRFARIYEGADGSLIRASGSGEEGTWTVVDTTEMNGPGVYQLDLDLDGAGRFPSFPAFLQEPTFLRLVEREVGDYLSSTVQPVPGVPPSLPSPEPPPDPELPTTGANLVLVLFAFAAVQLGVVLLRFSRRRPL